jgi:hypothetical protein
VILERRKKMTDYFRATVVPPLLAALFLTSCCSRENVERHVQVFQPKARVYFDSGTDDPDEVDIFNDGSLVPAINFVEIYWGCPFEGWVEGVGDADWTWGPALGLGITAPANNSDDGTNKASGAPVALASLGLQARLPIGATASDDANSSNESFVGLEFGRAIGYSADEGLSDVDDGAWYVGLTLNIKTK